MKCHLSTLALLLVAATALLTDDRDARVSTQPLRGANKGVLDAIARPGGHHNSPAVQKRGVSALPKIGRPPRPEQLWRPKKERSAKKTHHAAAQHPAPIQKHGKMPGEGKRWKWKALNTTKWKGAPAKRMPGFHLQKNKPLKRSKGKGKGMKSKMSANLAPGVAPAALPQPAAIPQAVAVSPPSVPASPQIAVWSSGQPVLPQPTSTPQAPTASQFVFNPQTQTWIPASAAVPSAPKGWAFETLAPKSAPIATTTVAPAFWAPATGALRGVPASSTFAPVAYNPAPAQFAPALPAQYQAAAATTTFPFWR